MFAIIFQLQGYGQALVFIGQVVQYQALIVKNELFKHVTRQNVVLELELALRLKLLKQIPELGLEGNRGLPVVIHLLPDFFAVAGFSRFRDILFDLRDEVVGGLFGNLIHLL